VGDIVINPFRKFRDRKKKEKDADDRNKSTSPDQATSPTISHPSPSPHQDVISTPEHWEGERRSVFNRLPNQGHVVELSEKDLAFLHDEMNAFGDHYPGPIDAFLPFIRSGESPRVLKDLHKWFLSVKGIKDLPDFRPERKRYFNTTDQRDPVFFYRLARVYLVKAQTYQNETVHWSGHWLDPFLGGIGELRNMRGSHHPLPFSLLVTMIEIHGGKPEDLRSLIFPSRGKDPWMGTALSGSQRFLIDNPEWIDHVVHGDDVLSKQDLISLLHLERIPLARFWEQIVDLCIWAHEAGYRAPRSKHLEDTVPLLDHHLRTLHWTLIPELMRQAVSGSPEDRVNAVNAIVKILAYPAEFIRYQSQRESYERCGPEAFFSYLLTLENDPGVRKVISDLLSGYPIDTPLADERLPPFLIPQPITPPEIFVPPPESCRRPFMEFLDGLNERIREEQQNSQSLGYFNPRHREITREQMETAFESLGSLTLNRDHAPIRIHLDRYRFLQDVQRLIRPVLGNPDLQLTHIIRLSYLFRTERYEFTVSPISLIIQHISIHRRHSDLREIEAVLRAVGSMISPEYIALPYSYEKSIPSLWDEQQIWPYFSERMHLIDDHLVGHERFQNAKGRIQDGAIPMIMRSLLRLSTFPEPPEYLIPEVWKLAIHQQEMFHHLAQEIMDRVPENDQRLLSVASSSETPPAVIITIAGWLARRNVSDAIPILLSRIPEFKDSLQKIAIISILESMGVPSESIVTREDLIAEARTELSRRLPKGLDWFPFDSLPVVRWSSDLSLVDPLIIQLFVLQSHKLKDPIPHGLLMKYCSLMLEEDRHELGRFILDTWLGCDLFPKYTREESEEYANKRADDSVQWQERNGKTCDRNAIYNDILKKRLSVIGPGAGKHVGILALCAACCGTDVVPVIKGYIEKWYGNRWRQCVALVDVLAWSGHSTGIQYLLMIADTFRTRSIREEAAKQVKLLAEREGWTVDQLGDRTIPTGGFSEDRTLVIDYGERQFTAELDSSFTISLFDGEGNPMDSLPDALPDEDEKHVKDEKKALNTAKKIVRAAVRDQTIRLYEALCSQRGWSLDEWERCFAKHPIAGVLIQRLVWSIEEGDSFIPGVNGSLVDADGNPVILSPGSTIRLAHTSTLGVEQGRGWRKFLKGQDIKTPVDQFSDEVYTLPEALKEDVEIRDFYGQVLPATTLRKEARRLGYQRGPADDNVFYEFKRKLLGIGLEVNLGFSGNASWNEDIDVTLKNLYFLQVTESVGGNEGEPESLVRAVSLGEVPPVLLAEAYGHMKRIAEKGEGCESKGRSRTGNLSPGT